MFSLATIFWSQPKQSINPSSLLPVTRSTRYFHVMNANDFLSLMSLLLYSFSLPLFMWRQMISLFHFFHPQLILLHHYEAWELFIYPTSHSNFYKYCLKLFISIFDLLHSDFYFFYKIRLSVKALVFSFWSGLLNHYSGHSTTFCKVSQKIFLREVQCFFSYPSSYYLRE